VSSQKESPENLDGENKFKRDLSICQKEIERLQLHLERAEKEREEVRAKLEPFKSRCKEIDQEKDELQLKMGAAETKFAEQAEAHEKELQKTEEERIALEKKVAALEAQLKCTEAQEVPTETITEPKSAFRVDLYPHQGQIQGRIEHLLSKDRKAFAGIDGPTILNFLERHVPGTPAVDQPVAAAIEMRSDIENVHLTDMNIFQLDMLYPTRSAKHDQPFEVRFVLDMGGAGNGSDLQFDYKASIFAKPLQGGVKKLIQEAEDTGKSAGTLAVTIPPESLTPGVYRLEATVSLKLAGEKKWPICTFREGKINVY